MTKSQRHRQEAWYDHYGDIKDNSQKLRKMIEKKMKNEEKIKRGIQFGIRSVHSQPNRFVACPAVDVMKYGVDRTCWVQKFMKISYNRIIITYNKFIF